MNYLDYVQMTTGQKIAYKIKSFFTGIPGALKGIVMAIVGFFAKVFGTIGNGFKNYGSRFAKGDGGTKLSYLIMGAGNMLHGQIVKGFIFLAVEVGYFYFMATFGLYYLSKMYCNNVPLMNNVGEQIGTVNGVVGSVPTKIVAKQGLLGTTYETTYGDDSSVILLYAVLSIIITIVFFAVYIANTKSAYATYEVKLSGKKNPTIVDDIRSLFDDKFHITLLSIPVIGLSLFTILPIIYTIFMAFTNYDKEHQPPSNMFWWVGFKNFADVFTSSSQTSAVFGRILLWTLVWAVFATFTNYVAGIILALMINKKGIKYKGFWRTVFIVTAAVPQFVTLLIMNLMLRDNGAVDAFFHQQLHLLSNANNARVVVIIVNLWVGIPYTMLITSGLLMNIPEDLYESARIDGANAVQQFTKITFPYIFFVTTPYLITTFVGNINNFNVIFLLTGGGPNNDPDYAQAGAGPTDLLVTWLYKLTLDQKDFNLAAVIGLFIFVLTAAGSLITFNMSKASKNEEEFS